jgi:hypothetical protein
MPLRYLLDENQRGPLWHVIQRHNARGLDPLDVVRVGDVPELPLGVDDPSILRWAEQEQRILVTFDKSTTAGHLANHLSGGRTRRAFSCCPAMAELWRCWSSWCWLLMPANPVSGWTAFAISPEGAGRPFPTGVSAAHGTDEGDGGLVTSSQLPGADRRWPAALRAAAVRPRL